VNATKNVDKLLFQFSYCHISMLGSIPQKKRKLTRKECGGERLGVGGGCTLANF